MPYYTSITVALAFGDAVAKIKERLKSEGFGVITEIDMRETLKNKLGVEFRNYKILGACNPKFAYEALQLEDKIAVLLPCNVIVQETASGIVEVAAIRPTETMRIVGSEALAVVAREVEERLSRAVLGLSA
jgi:uncharacterized protein (DUF302 family)